MEPLFETDLKNLIHRGKVRDTYELTPSELLLVATDRVSAFDVVLPNGIPQKGQVLCRLSAFWFEKTGHLIPNHMIALIDDIGTLDHYREQHEDVDFPEYLEGRSMLVRKADRIDIECVVRGYLSGSAWSEYQQHGTVSGEVMPDNLVESDKLAEPIFTPTTKSDTGHDEPITIKQMSDLIGEELTRDIQGKTMEIYMFAEKYARSKGIIIADTKMEYGFIDGRLSLIDELLTPDSSRFWDMSRYHPGGPQPSFDKQPLRDWLSESGWDKEPPPPELPPYVVEHTTTRYCDAYQRLTGEII